MSKQIVLLDVGYSSKKKGNPMLFYYRLVKGEWNGCFTIPRQCVIFCIYIKYYTLLKMRL